MNASVPATLRQLRRQAGLSLKDVAARLGVHFTTVSAWERGRSEPSLERLRELARLYGVEMAALLAGSPEVDIRRGFRPVSPLAGERLLTHLEELRLAICLGRALAEEGGPERLARTTGIAAGRLLDLASGVGIPRPAEVALLVRELGTPGTETLETDGERDAGEDLPPALATAIQHLLDRLRAYLAGDPGRQ
ncbi:MAG: helix-turn-helix transcriptional regulator [Acidobacteria bacterium]|nr:helix-turn-helix transcriptional regulator [Acidobacteriota bacterium]